MNKVSLNQWPTAHRGLDRLPGTPLAVRPTPSLVVAMRASVPLVWATATSFEVEPEVEDRNEGTRMKTEKTIGAAQPEPFTPGLTKSMVREHALRLYRERLLHGNPLKLEDWILAERDLFDELQKKPF